MTPTTKKWRTLGIHAAGWAAVVLLFSLRDLAFYPVFWQNMMTNIMLCLFAAVPVYLNMHRLVPKLLLGKKYWFYGITIFALVVLFSAAFTKLLATLFGIPFYQTAGGYGFMFAEFALIVGITTTVQALQLWHKKDQHLQQVKQHALEQELGQLRNQLNPHFLFNTLNGIYVMIRRDPEKARETLHRFSEMLSHQLYKSQKPWVSLEEEVELLQHYISLEQLRQGEAVQVTASFTEANAVQVPPMLFLPIVENAFKHGLAGGLPRYAIDLSLEVEHEKLVFSCKNDFVEGKTGRKGGIGLENIRRRLELLYPEKHRFSVEATNGKFWVAIDFPITTAEQVR